MIKKSLIILMSLLMAGFAAKAQQGVVTGQGLEYNVISTAVPFMIIAPDARSAGMGDLGVSTSPDVYSMHWNPAKYAFIEDDMSFGLAYSPWLRKLVPDMNIAYLAFSKRMSGKSAIAATLKYFSLGEINFRGPGNEDLGTYSPNEFAIDLCYSRKLGDYLSAAVAGRFIYSHLTQGVTNYSRAAWSVAADIGVYYQRPVYLSSVDGVFSWGVAITNMGSKMSYSNANSKTDFIPTNLRLGPTFLVNIDEYNSIALSVDINKLLVPTPPIYDTVKDANGNFKILKGMDPNVSMIQGMIQSFYDAPDGFSEELKEFTLSVGAEYWYNKVFAVRAGYFHESKMKGNRKYLTFGAGLRYNVFALDVSYLVPVNNTATSGTNPLEGTLRFNLAFNINKWGENTKLEQVNR
ncbi:MAG: type IX secretion system outer membrane channel protein PorV [Bacteroidales bacterium]|nr:type IX secretion system outer membrane channel protein PorV [Bacteroidales bacterium]